MTEISVIKVGTLTVGHPVDHILRSHIVIIRFPSYRFEVPWVQSAFDRLSADPRCEEFLSEVNRRLRQVQSRHLIKAQKQMVSRSQLVTNNDNG